MRAIECGYINYRIPSVQVGKQEGKQVELVIEADSQQKVALFDRPPP